MDDEHLALQALRRLFHPMREEWDLEFVESGATALKYMSIHPFDVVVTDMMMPGMNGAQLLTEVRRQYPEAVRLILSGHIDRQMATECVSCAHQYLSKPCEPDDLKRIIKRAASEDFHLQNRRIMTLVSGMDQLPSLPALFVEMSNLLRDPEVSMEEVGTIVAKDIAMTARLLKLVNSAFFGLRRQVSDPMEAASYLGVEILKSLVLSINVFTEFATAESEDFSVKALWNHSLRVGAAARLIAQMEKVEAKTVNESLVAGMLHDVGKLILASNFAEKYNQARELARAKSVSEIEAERTVFGCTHAEVGGALLGLWGLPVAVVEAITLHHRPSLSDVPTFTPLTAVHVADALVSETSLIASNSEWPSVDINWLAGLGLNDRLAAWQAAMTPAPVSAAI